MGLWLLPLLYPVAIDHVERGDRALPWKSGWSVSVSSEVMSASTPPLALPFLKNLSHRKEKFYQNVSISQGEGECLEFSLPLLFLFL